MSDHKVKIHYKEKHRLFDFDLIENLSQLRLAISLAFEDLPLSYEIVLEDLGGN